MTNEDGTTVAAVADGVGGSSGGDIAAQMAIEVVKNTVRNPIDIYTPFETIHENIQSYSELNQTTSRMATTLSLVIVHKNVAHVAHVGDSRIYHLRDAGLKDLTIDQTEVAELTRRGVLTKTQAARYPRKNVLLSYLAAKKRFSVETSVSEIISGDRVILLTDGVYQKVLRKHLSFLSNQNKNVHDFISSLQKAVEGAVPQDNYSALALQF